MSCRMKAFAMQSHQASFNSCTSKVCRRNNAFSEDDLGLHYRKHSHWGPLALALAKMLHLLTPSAYASQHFKGDRLALPSASRANRHPAYYRNVMLLYIYLSFESLKVSETMFTKHTTVICIFKKSVNYFY